MSSQLRPSFHTVRTTDSRQATLFVPPGGDPWQAATQHASASFTSDSQLAALRITNDTETENRQPQLEAAHQDDIDAIAYRFGYKTEGCVGNSRHSPLVSPFQTHGLVICGCLSQQARRRPPNWHHLNCYWLNQSG